MEIIGPIIEWFFIVLGAVLAMAETHKPLKNKLKWCGMWLEKHPYWSKAFGIFIVVLFVVLLVIKIEEPANHKREEQIQMSNYQTLASNLDFVKKESAPFFRRMAELGPSVKSAAVEFRDRAAYAKINYGADKPGFDGFYLMVKPTLMELDAVGISTAAIRAVCVKIQDHKAEYPLPQQPPIAELYDQGLAELVSIEKQIAIATQTLPGN